MNQDEFIRAVANRGNASIKAIKEVLAVMQDVVFEEMANTGEVKIFNGVTLYGKIVEAHTSRNPFQNTEVEVPQKIMPKVKFGTPIKNFLNDPSNKQDNE